MFINSTTSSGVSTTPRMLDNDALTMAAETWPRAIDVNAIEDCTVDGTRHKNSTPLYRSMVSTEGTSARQASPRIGKDHERGGQHQQVQSPLPHPVPGLLRRQPGAVEEEQQGDRRFRRDGHGLGGGAVGRQQGGKSHRRRQRQQKAVDGSAGAP